MALKLVFMGTPDIAVPSLEFFIKKEDIDVLAVVTQPDRPAGRGKKLTPPPVKNIAIEYTIPVYQPVSIRKDAELIQKLKELNPDVFITVAFGQILNQEVLDIPRLGTINLHSSLLPKYRGANPIQWPIINGDRLTGLTTMLTELGVDSGPILLQKEIEITPDMDSEKLYYIMADMGPQLLYDSMIGLNNGTITPKEQNHKEATHAPKVKKEDGCIKWCETSEQIHNKVRGLKPFPSTYTLFKDDLIKIHNTELPSEEMLKEYKEKIKNTPCGEIIDIINNGVVVSTGNGTIIIRRLQLTCKKPVEAGHWCNGARITIGDSFDSEEACSCKVTVMER